MTIQAFYAVTGGNYEEAQTRLMNEVLVKKFATRYASDPSYSDLEMALSVDDTQTAFRAAHTMKGVCMNLAFSRLAASASHITELLRSGNLSDAKTYFPNVKNDYEAVMAALAQLD